MYFQGIAAGLTAGVASYVLDSIGLNVYLKTLLIMGLAVAACWIVGKIRSE